MEDASVTIVSPPPSPDLAKEYDYEPSNQDDDDSGFHPHPVEDSDALGTSRLASVPSEPSIEMELDDDRKDVNNNVPDVSAADINSTIEFLNLLSFLQVFAPILMLPPFSFLELEQAIIFSRDDPLYAEFAARCIYLGQNRKDALKPDQWQTLSQRRIISGMKDSFVGFMLPEANESEAYQSLLDKTIARPGSDVNSKPSKKRYQNPLLMQWTDDCHSLSPYARLLILSNLCDWACSESAEILKFISAVDPNQFRPEPQGRDCHGNVYWFFHSSVQSQCGRLYQQNNQGQVRLVAQTLDELIFFLTEHDDGVHAELEPLCEFLRDEVIPNETIKAEAEQKKAQRLRRQGLASDQYSRNIVAESRRVSTRPVRFSFADDEPEGEPKEARGSRRSSRLG